VEFYYNKYKMSSVTVQLSKNYSESEKAKLQRLVFNGVQRIESEFKSTETSSERVRTAYFTEPKNADFSTANRVKCLVYSFTPTGEVRYGACVFRRFDHNVSNVTTVKTGNVTITSTTSQSGGDVFKKKDVRKTALDRYNKCPVTFKMDFKPQTKKVTNKVMQGCKLIMTVEHKPVDDEEQVTKQILQMMCDKENGGVQGKRGSVAETKEEFTEEEMKRIEKEFMMDKMLKKIESS
jgi:hypothetical protein